jgi:hypothetical protein
LKPVQEFSVCGAQRLGFERRRILGRAPRTENRDGLERLRGGEERLSFWPLNFVPQNSRAPATLLCVIIVNPRDTLFMPHGRLQPLEVVFGQRHGNYRLLRRMMNSFTLFATSQP